MTTPDPKEATATNKTSSFRVRGMDCAEEVGALRAALAPQIKDNERLRFDLLQGRMYVEQPGPDDDTVIKAIQAAGFDITLWKEEDPESEVSGYDSRAIACGISGGALVFGVGLLAFDYAVPGNGFLLLAVLAGSRYVFPKALAALARGRADMNLLMSVAVLGALLIGEWGEAATVAFLFTLALLIETWSIARARQAIVDVLHLTPSVARYRCPSDGDIEEAPVEQIAIGAVLLVRPGEKVPLDGEILLGTSNFDEAPITGESRPVTKGPGALVFAGTVNLDAAIEVRATATSDNSQVARILHMVEEAQSRRAPVDRWVDQFAAIYTPVMMGLSFLLACGPPALLGLPWTPWIYRGLVTLVIACPCALVISTPVTIVAALTSAARAGVLIKGGAFLETAAQVSIFALDKTGTLTYGSPRVCQIVALDEHTAADLLRVAASLEEHSTHPLARAILEYAEAEELTWQPASDFLNLPGRGAEGLVNGDAYWIGSHRLAEERGSETKQLHDQMVELESGGRSLVAIGTEDHICGFLTIADEVRDNAHKLVQDLKSTGIVKIVMLTGDNQATAAAIAAETGVTEFHAELLPGEKVTHIERLLASGQKVAMVGDGINDAPALAVASIGIAMGAAGSAAAIETADIALMSDDLSRLPWLISHSRRALAIVRQNIGLSLATKAIFLALNLGGSASLWTAIAADMGASLLVISNGLRLLDRAKEDPLQTAKKHVG